MKYKDPSLEKELIEIEEEIEEVEENIDILTIIEENKKEKKEEFSIKDIIGHVRENLISILKRRF